MRVEVTMAAEATVGLAEWRIGPPPVLVPSSDLVVNQTFALEGDALAWTITLSNATDRVIEVGDVAVPFEFAERTGARGDIYTRKLLRHAYVAGHGSWVYWQRAGGEGPYLVMTPTGHTKIEYYDSSGGMGGGRGAYTPYVHAHVASAAAVARGGRWRLPVTSMKLPSEGSGATVSYSFRFQWARDVEAVRDVLYAEGKFDIDVVPGMVVPTDLDAMFSLRSRNTITTIDAEHPAQTTIESAGERADGIRVYRVRFSRLGENTLRIRYGDGLWTTLEFFVTEPIETLIRKRAAFLVSHHQHKDPAKWYVGV